MPERKNPLPGRSIADALVQATSASREHDWDWMLVREAVALLEDPRTLDLDATVKCKRCGKSMAEVKASSVVTDGTELYKGCLGRNAR